MESTMVIKAKYGETLRRFNARIVDQGLDLDMNGLREKILGLFNLPSDANLKLTYIDEDGDVVTLVDEEDLHDVMSQALNPLRIAVSLNTERIDRSYTRSSGSSTPMRSPRVQPALQNLNTSVSEILKSVPEAIRETLSRLPIELASNTTSSSPGLAELVESLSKMGLTYLKEASESQAGGVSSTENGASGSTMDAPVSKEQKGLVIDGTASAMSPTPELKSNDLEPGNMTRSVDAEVKPATDLVNLNGGLAGGNLSFGCTSASLAPGTYNVAVGDNKGIVNKSGESNVSGKSDGGLEYAKVAPVVADGPCNDKMKNKKFSEGHFGWKSVDVSTFKSPSDYLNSSSQTADSVGDTKEKFSTDSSGTSFGLNSLNECPFVGTALDNYSSVPPRPYAPPVAPFKRSHNHGDGIGSIFHRGVRCDGCGVHPITGSRFKSTVKENYDLCSICFADLGNETDYIRMDRPATYRQPMSFKGFYNPHCRVRPPTLPQVLRGSGGRPKLDSCFIRDVNILDGTIMAPSTPFIKIWRIRNNGTLAWPWGTQLLWIGGDRLSKTFSIELEIPANGLPVDEELDVAVDFTAPELLGRYVSYWRLVSPSGQKFGQRVWVLIQVDTSLEDSFERMNGFNLNLPPVSSGITGPKIVNVNVEPMVEDSIPEPDNSNRATELVGPIIDQNRDQELCFPINDTLLVGGDASNPDLPESSLTVLYPIGNFSEPIVPAPTYIPATDVPASGQVVSGNNDVEQTLLMELEEMGFKQVDLNKEILRMNEYNLEQSVDDLCEDAEWDPILEELQEMGFCDYEMNKMLLKKNNGSIKRVVMDLISGEKK